MCCARGYVNIPNGSNRILGWGNVHFCPLVTHTPSIQFQGYSLVVSLLMVVSNLFYFEPQTTRCTFQKHKFEKEIQAGQAIGKVEEDKTTELRKNPEYCKLETRFVRLHTYASIANLLALAAQAVHLWYLAGHLDTI